MNSRKPADRIPPNDHEAEQSLLGCCMVAPDESLVQAEEVGISDGMFYDLRNRSVWESILRVRDAGQTVDVVTVCSDLKSRGVLETCGGMASVSGLCDFGIPSNARSYAAIVLDRYIRRKIIQCCAEATTNAFESDHPAEAVLAGVESAIMAIGNIHTTPDTPFKVHLLRALNIFEEMMLKQGGPIGVPYGFPDLDRMTSGMKKGELVILAGRPATGKTTLALNIVENVLRSGRRLAFFSLEMSGESLGVRMLSSVSRVNPMRGDFVEHDMHKLVAALKDLKGSDIELVDACGITINQLCAKARRMHRKRGLSVIFVDYLQLIRSSKKHENRQIEVAEMSSQLKQLARELGVPVIVLCQLNRDAEKARRRPALSDLRESGALEQDADMVGILWLKDPDKAAFQGEPLPVELSIAKQRNGATGDIHLMLRREITRFESAAKLNDEDVPT